MASSLLLNWNVRPRSSSIEGAVKKRRKGGLKSAAKDVEGDVEIGLAVIVK